MVVEGSKMRKAGKRLRALCSTNTRATNAQLERGTPATRSREDDFAVASERGRQASQEKPNRNRVTGHAEDIGSTMIAASRPQSAPIPEADAPMTGVGKAIQATRVIESANTGCDESGSRCG